MLLDNRKIGALLRCFVLKPELIEENVALTMACIDRMRSVQVGGKQFVSRIEVLVPMDPDYAEQDCGLTAPRLRKEILRAGYRDVFVSEVEHGDIFVSLLNYGIGKLLRAGCDYGIIFSKEAESYFTPEIAEDMVTAAEYGARIIGIAIDELTESIMQGRIANTFAMWDLMSLVQVGTFDLRNAKAKKNASIVSRARAWDSKRISGTMPVAGVEEIIPEIRSILNFGPCIAPLLPRGGNTRVWEAPNPIIDPEGYARHVNKLSTKFVRQSHFASMEHADLSFITGGIMKEYRHPNYVR